MKYIHITQARVINALTQTFSVSLSIHVLKKDLNKVRNFLKEHYHSDEITLTYTEYEPS